jgi:hypothetical protein
MAKQRRLPMAEKITLQNLACAIAKYGVEAPHMGIVIDTSAVDQIKVRVASNPSFDEDEIYYQIINDMVVGFSANIEKEKVPAAQGGNIENPLSLPVQENGKTKIYYGYTLPDIGAVVDEISQC